MELISENIAQVGRIMKCHGVKGEVTLSVTNDALFDATCIIVELDGLYVPFYIESRRSKSDTVDIVKIEGVESESDAAPLLGAPVFLKRSELSDEEEEWDTFEGYKLFDGETFIGEVVGIDDQTENVLLILKGTNGGEILIPAVDEWIENVDDVNRIITMTLPEGLIDN